METLYVKMTVYDKAEFAAGRPGNDWDFVEPREWDDTGEGKFGRGVALYGPRKQHVILEDLRRETDPKQRYMAWAYDEFTLWEPREFHGPTPAAALLAYARDWESKWKQQHDRILEFRDSPA